MRYLTIFLLSFASLSSAQNSYKLERIVGGLNRPVKFVNDPTQTQSYIVEQPGKIRVFKDGRLSPTDLLDITARVYSRGNETGLLGLALHPKFAENKKLYLNYTHKEGRVLTTRISEFVVGDTGVAKTDQERILLSFEQPFENHNGGEVEFGPDGLLYIGTGDGGSGGDPFNNGQSLETLLGKILRINVDARSPGLQYAIPSDNPFVAKKGLKSRSQVRQEIYAYGLRNPWRFSFDRRTGKLWAADVGQNKFEEIDIIEKGKNYGWKITEGFSCFEARSCARDGMVSPVFDYGRDKGQSVTGGHVYYGESLPALQGAYIYGDYVSGVIWSLRVDVNGQAKNDVVFESPVSPSAFAVDRNGEILVVDHAGEIHRLVKR